MIEFFKQVSFRWKDGDEAQNAFGLIDRRSAVEHLARRQRPNSSGWAAVEERSICAVFSR